MSELIERLQQWADKRWVTMLALGPTKNDPQENRLADDCRIAANEIGRLLSVETGYLARGLTIDSLTEQNAKLTRELAEARDALTAWRDWYWNAYCTGIAEETLDATDKILERKP